MADELAAMLLGDDAEPKTNDDEVAQMATMLKNKGNTQGQNGGDLGQLPVVPNSQAASYTQASPQTSQNIAMQQAAFIKALSFVKFIDLIKGKLPEKQKQIVSELNQKFAHRMINFMQYKEGLLDGIGKMKFDILVQQFNLTAQRNKNAQTAAENQRQGLAAQRFPVYANTARSVASPLADGNKVQNVGNVNVTVRPTRTTARKNFRSSSEGISDAALVNSALLRNRIEAITRQFRMAPADEVFLEFVNLALRERLKNAAEELVTISKKRVEDNAGYSFSFVTTSDTKNDLREIEKREKEIAQKRSAEEKKRLLEAARVNKKDKRENKVLQDKLNKVVQEEEAKMTNDTALIAVGKSKKPARKNAGRGRPKGSRNRNSTAAAAAAATAPAPASPASFGGNSVPLNASGAPVSKITYRDAMVFAERDTELRLGTAAIAQKCFLGKDSLKYSNKGQ